MSLKVFQDAPRPGGGYINSPRSGPWLPEAKRKRLRRLEVKKVRKERKGSKGRSPLAARGTIFPRFITDDERTYFIVEFPIHTNFIPEVADEKSSGISSGKGSGKSMEFILHKKREKRGQLNKRIKAKLEKEGS
jgi:hypothetical protein